METETGKAIAVLYHSHERPAQNLYIKLVQVVVCYARDTYFFAHAYNKISSAQQCHLLKNNILKNPEPVNLE